MMTASLILGWVVLATYADMLFKGAKTWDSQRFMAGVACYAACGAFALATFKRQQWGWIILMWNICSIALSMLISVLQFNEPFTMRRAIAMALIITAIFLTE